MTIERVTIERMTIERWLSNVMTTERDDYWSQRLLNAWLLNVRQLNVGEVSYEKDLDSKVKEQTKHYKNKSERKVSKNIAYLMARSSPLPKGLRQLLDLKHGLPLYTYSLAVNSTGGLV